MIWRHLVDDARAWSRAYEALLDHLGVKFLGDAVLFILLMATPVTVIYASRSLPLLMGMALFYALLYTSARNFAVRDGRLPPSTLQRFAWRDLPLWSLAILALIIYAGVSSLWAINPDFALEQAIKMLLSFFMAVAIWRLMPPLDEDPLRYSAPFGVAVAACVLIIELATPGIFRPHIYGINPSYLNRSVVVVSLLMWPALALTTGRYHGWQRAGLFLVVTAAVVISSSMSSLLALVAGLIVMAIAHWSGRLAAFGIVVATVAALIATPITTRFMSDIAVETGVDTMVDMSSERRLEIWDAFSRVALERPVLGWGLEASRYFGLQDIPGVEWTLGPVHHPHNPILQIWVELGAIGIALSGIAMIGLILSIRHMGQSRRPYAYGAMTATLAVSMVSHGAWQTWWICLLMLLVVLFNVREEYPTGTTI